MKCVASGIRQTDWESSSTVLGGMTFGFLICNVRTTLTVPLRAQGQIDELRLLKPFME